MKRKTLCRRNGSVTLENDTNTNATTTQYDWHSNIFQLNQLMFCIWSFLEFPAILSFASVHSSWKLRLWSTQVFTVKQWKRIPRSARYANGSKYLKVPQISDLTATITSPSAHFNPFVSQAIIKALPSTKFHSLNIVNQLFAFYSCISKLTFVGGRCLDDDSWRLHANRIKSLLQLWIGSNSLPDKTLEFVYCGTSDVRLPEIVPIEVQHLKLVEQGIFPRQARLLGFYWALPLHIRSLTLRVDCLSNNELIDIWESLTKLLQLRDISVDTDYLFRHSLTESRRLSRTLPQSLRNISIRVRHPNVCCLQNDPSNWIAISTISECFCCADNHISLPSTNSIRNAKLALLELQGDIIILEEDKLLLQESKVELRWLR